MSDKSYVGMFNCFFCGGAAGVLLDRRLKNTLPHNVGVINREPCSKCAEYMKQGIILISVKNNDSTYRTGGWWVVKEEAVRRFGMDTKILEFRKMLRFNKGRALAYLKSSVSKS